MKKLLVIIAALFLASAGSADEYFKWTDERGVFHFTNVPSSVPEEYKDKAERRVMPSEKETPSGSTRESPVATEQPTEEPKDRFGQGADFARSFESSAKGVVGSVRAFRASVFVGVAKQHRMTEIELIRIPLTSTHWGARVPTSHRLEASRPQSDTEKTCSFRLPDWPGFLKPS